MKCPECVKEGLKSTVHSDDPGMSTAMWCEPYYDEEGKYHDHDWNTTTRSYQCSNGHKFSTKTSGSCWCGWSADGERKKIHDQAIKPIEKDLKEIFENSEVRERLTFIGEHGPTNINHIQKEGLVMKERKLKSECSLETNQKLHQEFLVPKKFHWGLLLKPSSLIEHIKHNSRCKKFRKEFSNILDHAIRKEIDAEIINQIKKIQTERV